MGKNEEYEEGSDPLWDVKQKQMDALLLDRAFSNSYKLLTKQMSFDDMIDGANVSYGDFDDQFDEKILAILIYDPEEGPKLYQLKDMINYYIEREEYEKCTKIREIMNKEFPETILKE